MYAFAPSCTTSLLCQLVTHILFCYLCCYAPLHTFGLHFPCRLYTHTHLYCLVAPRTYILHRTPLYYVANATLVAVVTLLQLYTLHCAVCLTPRRLLITVPSLTEHTLTHIHIPFLGYCHLLPFLWLLWFTPSFIPTFWLHYFVVYLYSCTSYIYSSFMPLDSWV